MKPTKLFLALTVAVLLGACNDSKIQDSRVWDVVAMGYNNSNHIIKVTGVKLLNEHTEVALHVTYPAGYWIKVDSNIYLQADGEQYKVKAIVSDSTKAVPEFDKEFYMPRSGEVDFVMQFEPLPEGTEHFDFIEPGGWKILDIRNARLLPQGITDTYWRNAKTGDWIIGFAERHVIYDNAVWDIVTQTERDGSYVLTISRGAESMDVAVGPMKEGSRRIAIGKAGPIKCLPITTNNLPDYSEKDRRQGFKDNGYRMGDSVTIVGWLKEMPSSVWKRGGKSFSTFVENIITDEQQSFSAPMDSLGRFTLKLPLLNSSQAFLDWGRSRISTMLEPGETYFYLCDYTTGQRLFMGTDARLQNELLAYPHEWPNARMEKRGGEEKEAMEFWEHTNREREKQLAKLQETLTQHPNLSKRYIDYLTGYYLTGQGESMMQARFSMKAWKLPQAYMEYVGESIWKNVVKLKPYTLYRDFTTFKRDYIEQLERGRTVTWIDILRSLSDRAELSLTDEQWNVLDTYEAGVNKLTADYSRLQTEEEKQALVDSFNASVDIKPISEIYETFYDRIDKEVLFVSLRESLAVIDSVGCDQNLRDLHLAYMLYASIDNSRKPLDANMIAWMEQEIQLPAAKAAVKELNDVYLAVQRRELVGNSLKSSDAVKGMSDGEKILRKLIEPYKGKLILLDIWGTWCGPCKAALKNSQVEYAHLKDYDIIYLYLSNRSDEESWKNVIKEYNVTGDNVVHYNLPTEQQTAIEHFLGVNSFPTYKLIDRDGNILDVNADPRELDALENLLKTICADNK